MKLLDPYDLFHCYTIETQFRRLLLLKKFAACSTVHKDTSLDIYPEIIVRERVV